MSPHPAAAELAAVAAHLDRIESETARGECDPQRVILQWLRGLP